MTTSESMHHTEREKSYFVIKCGGSVLSELPESFYHDIVKLKEIYGVHPVIVHGGGPEISLMLEQASIETQFVDGMRVTSEEMVDIVEMVLSGKVNKLLVKKIYQAGGKAVGISGVDGALFQCEIIDRALGRVGKVNKVDRTLITQLSEGGYIPIVSPISMDQGGETLNINGDEAASAVAKALRAPICLVSDIPGIYETVNGENVVYPCLDEEKIMELIESGVIFGGMIPKVKSALAALSEEVSSVIILNGKEEQALQKAVENRSIGTRIVRKELEDVASN
ncbi:acetylglutamate kinase [Alkalihalobacillus sp. CinArs1]|uniref:acetylglutamate kinase n=1 Tax=Alkalihalobacillus sp. CinArs1 TaxID=2995314 RepID=UPI0022DD8683|nr:acetylglutamate kinase [Alkalihalobacillus sp. CinArs1]